MPPIAPSRSPLTPHLFIYYQARFGSRPTHSDPASHPTSDPTSDPTSLTPPLTPHLFIYYQAGFGSRPTHLIPPPIPDLSPRLPALHLFIYYQNITGAAFFPNTAIMMKPLSEVTGAGWKCQHDYFSYQALVLALTEFAVPKVSAAGMAGTRFLLLGKVATKLAAKEGFIGKVFKKIKPKAGWREEFKLEKNIIHVIYFQVRPHTPTPADLPPPHLHTRSLSSLTPPIIHVIYFQALLWFLQPFFPFGAVLGPILLFLDYKWEELKLRSTPTAFTTTATATSASTTTTSSSL